MASLEWNLAPSIIIGTALLLAAYLGAIGPFRKYIPTSKPVKPREFIQFILGILILFLALTSPLDAMSDDYLFSAHMIQHSLLTLAAPPLILAGIPGWLAAYIVRNPSINKAARIVTNPVLAFVLYNLVYSLWHLPVAYEAALENENIHIVEHLSFIVTAQLPRCQGYRMPGKSCICSSPLFHARFWVECLSSRLGLFTRNILLLRNCFQALTQ
jgi:cytochrome c oxidase assembly factor CtaG